MILRRVFGNLLGLDSDTSRLLIIVLQVNAGTITILSSDSLPPKEYSVTKRCLGMNPKKVAFKWLMNQMPKSFGRINMLTSIDTGYESELDKALKLVHRSIINGAKQLEALCSMTWDILNWTSKS
ncbi:hypothetical protein ACHAPG_009005 [Botrytis cinerea]